MIEAKNVTCYLACYKLGSLLFLVMYYLVHTYVVLSLINPVYNNKLL